MNEEQFISKLYEITEQVKRRLTDMESQMREIREWLETLEFFAQKLKEGVKQT